MPVPDYSAAGIPPLAHLAKLGKLSKREKKLAKVTAAAKAGELLSKKQKKKKNRANNQLVAALYSDDPADPAGVASASPAATFGPHVHAIDQQNACKYETFDVHEAKLVLSELFAWEFRTAHVADLPFAPEVAVRALRELDVELPEFLRDVDDSDAALLAVQTAQKDVRLQSAGYQPTVRIQPISPPPPTATATAASSVSTMMPPAAPALDIPPTMAFLAEPPSLAPPGPAASTTPQAGPSRVPDKKRALEQSMEELRARIAVMESMKAKKKQRAAATSMTAEATPAATADGAAAAGEPVASAADVDMADAPLSTAVPDSALPSSSTVVDGTAVLPTPPLRTALTPIVTDSASTSSRSASAGAPTTAMDVDPDAITSFLKDITLPVALPTDLTRSRSRTPLSAMDAPRPAKRFRPVAADFEEALPIRPELKRVAPSFARLDLVSHSFVIDISDDEEDDLEVSTAAGPSSVLPKATAAQANPPAALTAQELEIARLKAQITLAERKRKLAKEAALKDKAGGTISGTATPA